jgi:hypothetical protein
MIDLFNNPEVDLTNITCHSGGAIGSDTYWEKIGEKLGVKTRAYSYKTKYHNSSNKVEISDADFQEGIVQINRANHWLNRYGTNKYINLLARNWCQVKYSKQIIAIGKIVNPGEKSAKGYRCNSKYQSVDGGTGYAVQMGIDNLKEVFVFDQVKEKWFRWSYASMSFVETSCPKIMAQDFAGIGTREINPAGIMAIKNVYKKTFNLK